MESVFHDNSNNTNFIYFLKHNILIAEVKRFTKKL
jgi:hypothetical protein